MSDQPIEDEYPKPVDPFSLPPMFGPIESGKRTWKHVEDVDHDLIGYLLSCHLMLEHYMDEFLKAHYDRLDWDAAKLTFGQRVALLTKFISSPRFNPVSTIKHLNSLRNRLGHRVDYKVRPEDLLPFIYYLERATEQPLEDKSPKEVLAMFTRICAAFFAGSVSGVDEVKKRTR